MSRKTPLCVLGVFALCFGGHLMAQVEPDRNTPAGRLIFQHPDLYVTNEYLKPNQVPQTLQDSFRGDLARLGLTDDLGSVDMRTLRWATLMPAEPLLPGTGIGNNLSWSSVRETAPASLPEMKAAAWQVFQAWLMRNESSLRIDVSELTQPGRIAVHNDGDLIQIVANRQINGVPVKDSVLNAVINHGNLILFGARNWGEIDLITDPSSHMTAEEAKGIVNEFLADIDLTGFENRPELEIIPIQKGALGDFEGGEGLDYRLAWLISPKVKNELAHYQAAIDAQTGEILSFQDTNHYAVAPSEERKRGAASTRSVIGGVYPVSNDGEGVGGMEQPGFPMPFADVEVDGETLFTDTGGNLTRCVTGEIRTLLSGLYVRIEDQCGQTDETSLGDIDLEQGPGTDCDIPPGHSAGDTHASRTGFYELNRIKEIARAQLPDNDWLKGQLRAVMNINENCNATWANGSFVRFYTSGGGCGNTGEIAAIFDHEWGHGMDDNDVDGVIGFPGEGIADIYSTLRLNDSCVGAGFVLGGNCGGYGDGCLDCSGVRDVDWAQHTVGEPWGMDYIFGTGAFAGRGCNGCGGTSHCEGHLISSSVWDLVHRKLNAPPYNLDLNTALEIGTRLTYLGAGPTTNWFTCNNGSSENGCAASSGYMNYLAADDDNGNLADGTPHMGAIFAAFNDHDIACSTPTVQDGGCAGAPTIAPVVNGTGQDRGAMLDWDPVAGASRYKIYRAEGVFQCDFGKVLLGETTETEYLDTGLRNGIEYSYIVIPFNTNDACFGPASDCANVTPAAGPNLSSFFEGTVVIATGDGDAFVDNCEDVSMTIAASNIGAGTQNNVRIVGAFSSTHPDSTFDAGQFPIQIAASLAECADGTAVVDFTPQGLIFGDTMSVTILTTSDELAGRNLETTVTIQQTESDSVVTPTKTFSFEAGTEGWTVEEGTFNRTGGGGGSGTTFRIQSSGNLGDQCDHIKSPAFIPTASTTVSIWTNYDIEAFDGQWWDRANVGLQAVGSSVRQTLNPDGGRAYEASGVGGTCGTEDQGGWADSNPSWASSTFSAGVVTGAGLNGTPTQISIRYGTDPMVHGTGFLFDEVTLTNIMEVVADTQEDSCLCPSSFAGWPNVNVLTLVQCLDDLVTKTPIAVSSPASDTMGQ